MRLELAITDRNLLEETPTDPQVLATQCAAAMFARDEASRALGVSLTEIRPGRAAMAMEIKPWMANGDSVCHGGFLFSLADTAMAYASNSRNAVYVAVSASIEFLAPGLIGKRITAIATEVHRVGRTATYDVRLCDPDSNTIAAFLGRTYRVRGTVIDGAQDAARE